MPPLYLFAISEYLDNNTWIEPYFLTKKQSFCKRSHHTANSIEQKTKQKIIKLNTQRKEMLNTKRKEKKKVHNLPMIMFTTSFMAAPFPTSPK